MKGQARTLKEPVTLDLWRDHLEGRRGLGIVPVNDEGESYFGAIDVDIYDLNLEKLEKVIGQMNLPLVLCRTKSGGAHLYIFFKSACPAADLRQALMEWAIVLGYPNSEVFPKQSQISSENDVGSWINMPYFEGERTVRYAIRDGEVLSPEEFLDYADSIAVDPDSLGSISSTSIAGDLEDGPPCLQHLSKAGFPEGTRNKGLFNLGVFCKQKYGDEWKEKLDEFNRKFLLPPLSSEEVKTITGSLKRKKYFYTCKDAPIVSVCNKSICIKRQFGIGGSGNDPGVALDSLTKIKTDPPTWIVNVDGQRVSFEKTDDLINQTVFLRICMENLNILPQRVSKQVWDDQIRSLLEKVEEIDAPEDAGVRGQFIYLVELFCSEQSLARDKEDLLLGRPYIEEGITYFRSSDVLAYAEKRRLRVTAKEAWNILREIGGAVSQSWKVKGRFLRCWGIPSPSRQSESFNIPAVGEGGEF